jgi:hypothetical protein
MRLVIKWSHGDECTYSCDETEPVEYSSAEAFIVDFESAIESAVAANLGEFMFANCTWWTDDFQYRMYDAKNRYKGQGIVLPSVLTVDEWFAQNNQ